MLMGRERHRRVGRRLGVEEEPWAACFANSSARLLGGKFFVAWCPVDLEVDDITGGRVCGMWGGYAVLGAVE